VCPKANLKEHLDADFSDLLPKTWQAAQTATLSNPYAALSSARITTCPSNGRLQKSGIPAIHRQSVMGS
jgi:hypothetical protein